MKNYKLFLEAVCSFAYNANMNTFKLLLGDGRGEYLYGRWKSRWNGDLLDAISNEMNSDEHDILIKHLETNIMPKLNK